MAGKIKGITISINGDTTGLDKALGGVNAKSKGLQSELKAVERLLKFDPQNTVLLEQKQKLLADAVGTTREKLSKLKEAEKQAQEQFAQGKISEEQYRALQREIVTTEQNLKTLEKKAKDLGGAFKQSLDIASAKMEDFGKKTEAAGRKMAPVSGAAAGVIAGMLGMAVAAGKSADDINTLAKQTGLSVEEIQKYKYAAELIDVPLEAITGSMVKLTKNMSAARSGTGASATAFKKLGISVTDGNGALRDNNDVFSEVITKLGTVKNETERNALASQMLGRSYQELNPFILGGADALKIYGEELENNGLILTQEELDAANKFNDILDKIGMKAAASFSAVGTEIAKILIPLFEKLAEKLESVLQVMREMDPGTLKLIGTILLIVAGIAPLLIGVGKISLGISSVIKVCTTLAPVIAAISGFITTTLIPAITAVVAAIGIVPIMIGLAIAAVVAIGIAIANLWKTNEDFRNKVIEIWDAIKAFFARIGNWFVDLFTKKIPGALQMLKDKFKETFEMLGEIAKKPINGIITILNKAIEGINTLIAGLNSIKVDIPEWVPWLGGKTFKMNIPSIPEIPMLANGGTLSNGQAIVAEAGPELIRMMNGKTTVTPLTNGARNTALGGTVTENYYVTIDAHNVQEFNSVVKFAKMAQQQGRAR